MDKYVLVLIRHGESEWNKKNLFTGWTDVDLTDDGKHEAYCAGKQLSDEGFIFDVCFTSYLKRAIHTEQIVLDKMDLNYIPVVKSWKLNERHYGALQGLNKAETAQKYGEEQVKIWRRAFDVRPPQLDVSDARNPALQSMYSQVEKAELPLTESLKDTIARVIPYFEQDIKSEILSGKRVLIAAHGNSLRALIMYLEKMSEKEILEYNLPTGVPLVYELDNNLKVISKRFIGDESIIAEKMQKVANQGKVKK